MRRVLFALENLLLYCWWKLFRGADKFEFQGRRLRKFVSLYNHTFRNERCVEVAVALDVLARYSGADVLEVGNVSGHYRRARHDVIDKYERAPGVRNVDIADFRPGKAYDLIFSISTLEHIGFDETSYGGTGAAPEQSGDKVVSVVAGLKALLKPGGLLLLTVPFGYNKYLDRCTGEGRLELTETCYYRDFGGGDWRPVEKDEAEAQPYTRSGLFWRANAIFVGMFRKAGTVEPLKRKPRVLVVYDYRDWILGKWAANIERLYRAEFDVIAISMFHAEADQAYAARLAAAADVIHLLLPHAHALFKRLAPDRPLIGTIHHWVPGGEDHAAAIQGSDRLVTGAEFWKERLVERGVPRERVTVVHSGVEDRYFEEGPGSLAPSAKLTCGFFGKGNSNEADRKGTRHLLRLAQDLAARGAADRVRLVIAGPGWEAIAADLRATGIETLRFPFVEDRDMPSLYRSLDAYLMLSDVEGGPVTIAEAMAAGCLVLSTRTGIAGEIVQDGVTGLLIDAADTARLAGKLLQIHADPASVGAMRTQARRFALDRVRYERTMAPLVDVYRAALQLGRRPGAGEWDTATENRRTDAQGASVVPKTHLHSEQERA